MQWFAGLAAFSSLLACSAPSWAQAHAPSAYRTVTTTSWVEEWDPSLQRWVRLDRPEASTPARVDPKPYQAYNAASARRLAAANAIAQYGPFLVLDEARVAMIGSTDSASPHQFDAMMRDFPGLQTLELIEAPGTTNDIANLALGRRIRAAGLATFVPRWGSVRSGAVEIFLAGKTRRIAPGAQFAVHAWLDNYGREPQDFAPDDPANQLYLDYYTEMGMNEARAKAFYAMTNSVPHASAKWLRADEMRDWITPQGARARLLMSKAAPLQPHVVKQAPLALPFLKTKPKDMISDASPQLPYANLSAVALASARPFSSYAFLDSPTAFP
ncbi:MAG: alpha/beta hydrolase [Pseudomonadota bacterium]